MHKYFLDVKCFDDEILNQIACQKSQKLKIRKHTQMIRVKFKKILHLQKSKTFILEIRHC